MKDTLHIARDTVYRQLVSDLDFRPEGGGLFLLVYRDDAAVKAVTAGLKKDLGDENVTLSELAEQTGVGDLFRPMEDSSGEFRAVPRLVQYLGVESLSEQMRLDLLGHLQHRVTSLPPSGPWLGLWITPEFEKLLFLKIPGLYHRTDGVYDFSALFGEEEPPRKPAPSPADPSAIPFAKISLYLEKVIHQFENWKRVRESGEEFLIDEMRHADLHDFYLPARFTNNKGKTFLLDDLLKVFLENKQINFLTLLGGEGMGKTAFALHYFIQLSKQFLKHPEGRRIPVFISLKDYAGRLHVEEFLIGEFERTFQVRLSSLQLQDMLLRGRFVFFADGFDRMASAYDIYLTRDNLESLVRLSLKNILIQEGVEKPQAPNKVFITCRPHYYLVNIQEKNTLRAGYTPLYRHYATKENYQLVRINPRDPDETRLKIYIIKNGRDPILARNVLSVVMNPDHQNRLSEPSLLAEIVCRTLNCFKEKREANLADFYRAYADMWIQRDDWRFRILPEGKRILMHRMALKMIQKADRSGLHYSELEAPKRGLVKKNFPLGHADGCRDEILACEFIVREQDGHYRFVHPSFMHYFAADAFFRAVRKGTPPSVPYVNLEADSRDFLKLIISSEKSDLRELNLNHLDLEGINLYQADLAGAGLNKSILKSGVLIRARLTGADLSAADLSMAKMSRSLLEGADLSGADAKSGGFREADLTEARLNGTNFRGADLRGARLMGARMAWADLREADLTGADLTGAKLTDADLTGANLFKAILNEADLSGATLSGAHLGMAEANTANFTYADLSRSDLTGASLNWAHLHGATLTLAEVFKTRLREADLTRANLDEANCAEADLRWARLPGAKLQNASFHEADLTGADLTKAKLTDADLSWANLNGVRLTDADLSNARLNMVKLRDARLIRANFSGADLTWADLTNADFTAADLTRADLSEADLSGCVLRKAKLAKTRFKGANLRTADLTQTDRKTADFEGVDLSDTKL